MKMNDTKLDGQVISQDSNGRWTVSLALSVYDKSAVLAAAYKFNSRCRVNIDPEGEDRLIIKFQIEKKYVGGEHIVNEFCQEVLDQQCRQDLEGQFGHIRDLIVEQAFKPVADLMVKIK